MSNAEPSKLSDQIDPNDSISTELARMPRVDLDPWLARSTRAAALRQLQRSTSTTQPSLRARYEPAALYVLSTVQLLWAATRVIAWLH
jgi:hypothetical protein